MNTLSSPFRARALRQRLAPALLLAVGLSGLLATACAASPGADDGVMVEEATTVQGDLVGMLPADISTIVYIDFIAVRDTPFYDFIRSDAEMSAGNEIEDIIERTGMDPRKDLHRIAYASTKTFGTMDEAGGVLIQATFDRARIEEMLAAGTTEEYSGRTLYDMGSIEATTSDDNEDGEPDVSVNIDSWLTILDDGIIALGDSDKIRGIVDVVDGAPSARDNDELMGLLQDVDPSAQIWMVSSQEGLFDGITPGEGSPIGQIGYDRINALIVGLNLTDGVSLRMRGRTPVQEDAKNLGDALNGMLALGKMMLQGNSPEVFEILDRGVEAGSSGRDVTINAQLTMEDLLVLRDYARMTFSEGNESDPIG